MGTACCGSKSHVEGDGQRQIATHPGSQPDLWGHADSAVFYKQINRDENLKWSGPAIILDTDEAGVTVRFQGQTLELSPDSQMGNRDMEEMLRGGKRADKPVNLAVLPEPFAMPVGEPVLGGTRRSTLIVSCIAQSALHSAASNTCSPVSLIVLVP